MGVAVVVAAVTALAEGSIQTRADASVASSTSRLSIHASFSFSCYTNPHSSVSEQRTENRTLDFVLCSLLFVRDLVLLLQREVALVCLRGWLYRRVACLT